MGGIAGFTHPRDSWKPDESERVVMEMTRRLIHRGRGAFGIWRTEGGLFGHRRLTIIDRSGGSQPMTDPGSGCTVTFNGEIYNYLEINAELKARGVNFQPRYDTET